MYIWEKFWDSWASVVFSDGGVYGAIRLGMLLDSMLATTVAKIQERSPLKYNFARKLASLDPRVMVSNPDQAIKMFQEVLQRLIETRWENQRRQTLC